MGKKKSESTEERQRRCGNLREWWNGRDPANKEAVKIKNKKSYQETTKNETPTQRRARLDKKNALRKKRLAKESPAETQKRLAKEYARRRRYLERVVGSSGLTNRDIMNQKRSKQYHEMVATLTADEMAQIATKHREGRHRREARETAEQTQNRLEKRRAKSREPDAKAKRKIYNAKTKNTETEEQKMERLAKCREQRKKRVAKETDEHRQNRLAKRRENYQNLPLERKQQIRLSDRRRYRENRERCIEATLRWQQNNPEKYKMGVARYRQKVQEKWLNMTEEEKQIIWNLKKQRKPKIKGFCDISNDVVRRKRKNMQKIGLKKIQPLTDKERKDIEKDTKTGSLSSSWRSKRIGVCTATRIHRIVVNKWADLSKLAQSMTFKSDDSCQSIPMKLGIKLEKTAVTQYMERQGIPPEDYTYPVGLTIHPELAYIGCTPDALTGDGVCEFKYSTTPISLGKPYLEKVAEHDRAGRFIQGTPEDCPLYRLRRNSQHFHQIVTQMICTNASHGTIVVYYDKTSNVEDWEFWIDEISYEEAERAWCVMEPRIQSFYRHYFVPEDKWDLIQPSSLCDRLAGTEADDDDEFVYDDADDDYETGDEDEYEDLVDDVVDYVLDEKRGKNKITTIGKVVTRAVSKAIGSVSTLPNRLTRKASKSDSESDDEYEDHDDDKHDDDYKPGKSVKKNVKKILQRGRKFAINVASNTIDAIATGYDFLTASQSFATPSTSVGPSNVKNSDSFASNYGQAHAATSSFKRLPVETPKQTYKRQAKIKQINPPVQSNSLSELLASDSNRHPNRSMASIDADYMIGRQSDRTSLMRNASIHNPPAFNPMTNLLLQNPPIQRHWNRTSQINTQPPFIRSVQNRVVTEVVDKPVDDKETQVVEDVKIKQRTSNRNRKQVMEY